MFLKPGKSHIEKNKQLDLNALVPNTFSGWKVDESVKPLLPPPEVEQKLAHIYDETLARTYVNSSGQRVMLSIAYGGDQTGRLRVHRPESCYTAQGFLVKQAGEKKLDIADAKISIKRLVAQFGARNEPITYWIKIGSETVTGLFGQRLVQLKYGLTGQISDGLIFRVSSIGPQPQTEYDLQERFVNDLAAVLTAEDREKLFGAANLN